MKPHVPAADVCGQTVEDFLQLLHRLGNPLAPQVHLGEKGAAKTVISKAGPEDREATGQGPVTKNSCLPKNSGERH